MAFSAVVVRVMIASPSDVEEERQIAADVINEWNAVYADSRGMVLMPVRWETHGSAQYGRPAQEDINEHLTDLADIVVGIFWTKLGTPTSLHPSGSVEEIKRHSSNAKPTMLYFSEIPLPASVDTTQLEAVRSFKQEVLPNGTIWTFDSRQRFREIFTRHLALELTNSRFSISTQVRTPEREEAIPLSADAAALLTEAGKSDDGMIMRIRAQALQVVQTNRIQFTRGSTVRVSARWIAALEELAQRNFVTATNEKRTVYQVTDAGYKYLETHMPVLNEYNSAENIVMTSLSQDAQSLLASSVTGDPACVLEIETLGGWKLQAGDDLFPQGTPSNRQKEEARWRAALRELIEEGCLDHKTGDIYRVSHEGFELAERVKNSKTPVEAPEAR